jgi:hypothetical protein
MLKKMQNMSRLNSYLTKGLLWISGLIATGIAATILFVPDAFYAGYGIDIGSDVSLANELKAPAGLLFMAGLMMLAGVFRAELTVASLGTAMLVYLSYGLSRLLSMVSDGIPHCGLLGAAILEIAIGVACLLVFLRHRRSAFAPRMTATGG